MKCQNCKFYAEPNEYHKYCLCLFMCEEVIPNQKCINEKEYYNQIKREYKYLIGNYYNLVKVNFEKQYNMFTCQVNEVNKIVWKYGKNNTECLQKIDEYIDSLKHEIEEYDIYHIDN